MLVIVGCAHYVKALYKNSIIVFTGVAICIVVSRFIFNLLSPCSVGEIGCGFGRRFIICAIFICAEVRLLLHMIRLYSPAYLLHEIYF